MGATLSELSTDFADVWMAKKCECEKIATVAINAGEIITYTQCLYKLQLQA